MTNIKCRYILSIICFLFNLFFQSYIYCSVTVKQYSNIDGLSNNSINTIFQDSENKLWLGTWDGLNVFNGRDFIVYRYNNTSYSLSNNIIRQIEESSDGSIWVSTDFGINQWDKTKNQFKQYFVDDSITSTKKENAFWIGILPNKNIIAFVDNQGLFCFDKRENKFQQIDGISDKSNVKRIIINGLTLYILYSNGKLDRYSLKDGDGELILSRSIVNSTYSVDDIFKSLDHTIIYADHKISIEDVNNMYPSTIDTNPNKTVSQVQFYNHKILLGYYEGGLDAYDTKTRQFVMVDNYPQTISIFSMFSGSQDILWIGTDGQGLFQLYNYKSAFNTVQTNYPVRAFCEYNEKNKLLIGTKGNGILLFNKEDHQIQQFATQQAGLISNSVYSISKNNKGDIFIGTEGEGLNVIQNGRLYKLKLPDGAPYFRSVYSIEWTNNDSCIWLGTSGFGLIKIKLANDVNGNYSVAEISQYSTSNNFKYPSNDIIYSIAKGKNTKDLWVSTRRDGLFLFDTNINHFTCLREINTQSSISNNDILTLLNNQNKLWIGTSYGLNEIDLEHPTNKIEKYTEKQGLANNTIHGILINGDNIWLSTNLGLSEINTKTKLATNYTIKDGLQNDEFSDGASFKDSDTTFYFGGVDGFSFFEPDEINLRKFQPKVIISSLKVFNTSINVNDRIKDNTLNLDYDEAYITITFLAEDYINNKNCEYKYRIKNLSQEWINNGQNPNIVLTNLLPGKHELQVQVTNGDRVWSDSVYTLVIDVAYPWWLSTPAIIVYFFFFFLVIYLAYLFIRNRIRQNRTLLLDRIEKENQRKIHESKLDFFTNVAHEFFTPLTLIYGPAQHLLEKSDLDDYTKRYIHVIKNNADRMQKLISELMDFRKMESGHTPLYPEKIDVKLLIDYITDNYTEIFEETKIDFSLETNNLSMFTIDRNSIEKVLFNLISNAFKYTPKNGYIKAYLEQKDGNLQFSIRNSGKGLTEKQMTEIFNKFKIFGNTNLENAKSTGIGLNLVKGIVELLNGSILVNSQLHEYVEFIVKIPELQTKSDQTVLIENSEIENYSSKIIEQKDVTILIVEDEKEIRELLTNILSPYYHVEQVSDGLEALNAIAKNTPDAIISDILMPNLDGMQLIKQLKENELTSHIPIINLSAKNSLNDKLNAYEYGADLYITKPFHPRHILVTIQNLIKKKSKLKDFYRSELSMVTVKNGIQLHQEDENILHDIVAYIEKHLDDETLNPNSIAEALGISKASLYRKMEELKQKTPSEFVRGIRLNHAGLLLKSTKMTVQEIMFKSGFTNKSYFYREFAKQFKKSPSEYRQS